jgi:DNA-binding MarR family transcriptional regulator
MDSSSEAEPVDVVDDEFALARSIGHLLHRAQQMSADLFTHSLGDDRVTLRQFAVLSAVSEQDGRSQSDLVRVTGIDRSTLADMITRMERKGLVVREASSQDGRAKNISLTPWGKNRLDDVTPHAKVADAAILGMLPRNKRRAFLETLAILAIAADRAADAGADAASDEPGKRKKKAKDAPSSKSKGGKGKRRKAEGRPKRKKLRLSATLAAD